MSNKFTFTLIAKAIAVWCAILGLAIVNGDLRERWLIPALGTDVAFFFSGVSLSLLICMVTFFVLPWFSARDPKVLRGVGVFWLVLTVTFEFGAGRFLMGRSWPELLQAYTFKDGNIWPLVLIVTALAPWGMAQLRAMIGWQR